ncbi:MAG TPA: acyl-CoA dehydrogenase family protein [Kofleriaceae bacterium]
MLAAARAQIHDLSKRRAAHDAAKQLQPAVVGMLREHGFQNCLLPHLLGGAELEPAEYIQVLETLARGDAATGWVTMTSSTSAMLGAYLPRTTANLLWASGAPMLAGVFAPGGQLADGVLNGQWSWASGSRHADWFALGAIFEKRHLVCFVPSASVRIVENWDTLGLAGTGSHDVRIENVRIAADHTCSLFGTKPWPNTPLYRVPVFGLLAVGIASCALGIARSALDHAGARLKREPGEQGAPSPQLAKYAGLHAQLAAARAYLIATATSVFDAAKRDQVDASARGELRLAASHVTEQCAEVARGCFHIDGAAAVRANHPLQLALRDLEVVMTHKMVVDRVLPATARALLGIGTPPPDL